MAGLVVETTKNVLFEAIPKLRDQYWEKSAEPKPKWMDRLQAAAGEHKSGDDPHIAGRALDIILFSSEPGELDVANRIVQAFLKLRSEMRWIAVIYNREQWHRDGSKTPRLRKGDPSYEHITHIHIEWDAANMNHTGFESDLKLQIKRIVDGLPLAGESFYFYFGDSNPTEVRARMDSYIKKIKAKGGEVTDVLSIWANYVVALGNEVKKKGDPLDTDLERARMLGVKIIDTSELDAML